MGKENLHLDDFFRRELNSLSGDQEPPSWETVSRAIGRKRKEKRIFFYSAAAAGLLLLAGSTLLVMYDNNPARIATPSIITAIQTKEALRPAPETGYHPADTLRSRNKNATGHINGSPLSSDEMAPPQTGTGQPLITNNISGPTISLHGQQEEEPVPKTIATATTGKGLLQRYDQPADDHTSQVKTAFHTGVLIGYQRGFQTNTSNAPVLSSLFRLELGSKIALSVQPALAYNKIQRTTLSNASYYANLETDVQQTSENTPNGIVYSYNIDVAYDSLNVSYVAGSGFWQAELPLYVHYKLAPRLSVFTGAAVRYTSNIRIREEISTSAATSSYVVTSPSEYLPQGALDDMVRQSVPGALYNADVAERNISSGVATVSVLYSLGIQYQVNKRIGLEILGNKNLSGFKHISNKEIRSLHQQPNLRISILYNFGATTGK